MDIGQQPASDELVMSPSAVIKELEKSIEQQTSRLNQVRNEKAIVDAQIEELRARSADLTREMDTLRGAINAETVWRNLIRDAVQQQSSGVKPTNQGEANG
ncbi:MAG: hypothetical protein ABW250_09035 [Pyrinomonadaceae bacterium]